LIELPEGELSSWKEIAAYLGVGVRTAQIWEQERGLPVSRLPGGRGRVRATVAELAAWKDSGRAASAPAEALVSTEAPGIFPSVRRGWLRPAGVSAAVLVAVLVAIALYFQPGLPVSFRLERDALIILDARGRVCWRKVFPYTLIEAQSPEMASRFLWIGDLDGDGRNEILFAPHPLESTKRESTPLICYSDRGVERWRYANQRRVHTSEEQFDPVYSVARYLVASLGKGQPNAIVVSSTHTIYYPCQVVLLTAQGQVLREYWHSGHLNYVQSADLDGDGKTEFYLAGINNARHAATVVILDRDHFSGAGQEPQAPQYQFLGFADGVDRARIILPRSCLNTSSNPYNPVATFSVGPDEIVVQTAELIGPGAGIFHHLSLDLQHYRAVLSDSYKIEHQRAVLEGRLQNCPPDSQALQIFGSGDLNDRTSMILPRRDD
jgi:hypothetical protein